MAAQPKMLRIVESRARGPRTRTLEIECVEGGPLSAVGGKYVIVHTGAMAGDRPVKRAYSLRPVAGRPGRAHLTIKRLGPGSAALHDAPAGTALAFSGPWGKLVPEGGLHPRTLLVATDTGITAALGVVEEHARAHDGEATVLWLRAADDTFLDVDEVGQRVTETGARFAAATIPPVDAPDRRTAAWSAIDARIAELGPTLVIAAGDGAIIHPLPARWTGAPGPLAERERRGPSPGAVPEVRLECFFHNPEKKIA